MYGLIHSAARELVLESMGPEMWANILKTCGLSEEHFINGKRFEDGQISLADLRDLAAAGGEPARLSGKQEYVENLINDYMFS